MSERLATVLAFILMTIPGSPSIPCLSHASSGAAARSPANGKTAWEPGTMPQVWAHRGYWKKLTENSLPSFEASLDLGAKGIELDIWYDDALARFVVSHDFPYARPYGRLLYLDDVFAKFGGRTFYWLDFKNVSRRNVDRSVKSLHALLKKYDLFDRGFVEHGDEQLLRHFPASGIQAILALPGFEHYSREKLREVARFVRRSPYAGVSIDVQNLKTDLSPALAQLGFPAFLYTVNDGAILQRFMRMPNVRVILSDEPFYRLRPEKSR